MSRILTLPPRYGDRVWARIHKIDRVRPQPNGRAIILVEDERTAGAMGQRAALSTLIAIARVLNAHRVIELKYNSKGEVRYATNAKLPTFMFDAIRRAGAAISDRAGEQVTAPADPASVSSTIDLAFSDLASELRSAVGATDMIVALRTVEARARKTKLDRDQDPAKYWTSVFELASLAGELSRPKQGRWVDIRETPVPFALKFPEGAQAMPTKLAQQIVEGAEPIETMATDVITSQ